MILVVIWLVLQESQTLIGEGKCRKQERFGFTLEILALSFLAVLVHHVSDDAEVDSKLLVAAHGSLALSFLNESISLGMSVGEQNHHHSKDHGLLLVGLEERVGTQEVAAKDVVDEALNDGIHFILGDGLDSSVLHVLLPNDWLLRFHLGETSLMERVELVLVEFSHRSEAGSLEEEVEVLIVFRLLDTALFPLLLLLNFILYEVLGAVDLLWVFLR